MGLETHIASLLYRYQCVVVPGFGAFLSQSKSAYLQADSNTFYPPYKEMSFNARLDANDGLLVSHIAHIDGDSYENTLEKVLEVSRIWKETLLSEGILEFPDLGVFRLNKEKNFVFEPNNRINYLMTSFGLAPVIGNPVSREVMKEEVRQMEERIPFTITPETREVKGVRPLMKYAAVVFLAVASALSGYSLYQQRQDVSAVAREEAQKVVLRNIQEATFFNTEPVELPSVNIDIEKKAEAVHHIIAGAYRIRENADKRIKELISKGYPASYLGQNSYGLHQVAFASYDNAQDALEDLKDIRISESRDAWLLSKR